MNLRQTGMYTGRPALDRASVHCCACAHIPTETFWVSCMYACLSALLITCIHSMNCLLHHKGGRGLLVWLQSYRVGMPSKCNEFFPGCCPDSSLFAHTSETGLYPGHMRACGLFPTALTGSEVSSTQLRIWCQEGTQCPRQYPGEFAASCGCKHV